MAKYIAAEAAVETFRLWFERIGTKPSFEDVQTIIQQVPAADVEPVRHGRWVWVGGIPFCSACNNAANGDAYDGDVYISDYCPFCGAKMDGEA